jgi:hypothetical protein
MSRALHTKTPLALSNGKMEMVTTNNGALSMPKRRAVIIKIR